MHLLAISDLHGNRVRLREILAHANDADVIVLAGDLTHLGSPDEAAEAVAICKQHAPHVLTVTGNCDDELIERRMVSDGNSLTGTGRVLDGVGFFGVSAGTEHLGNTWEVSEAVMADWLASGYRAIAHASRKILVSHSPPYGFVDLAYTKKHGGSRAVRAALDQYDLQLVVCGHIHEARGLVQYNGTTVINCGPAWMGYYAEVELGERVQGELKSVNSDR
jgi:Icc-related predicted phosphoesterase